MSNQNTSNQGLPYPDDNTYVKDVPDHIRVLALAIEKQLVQSWASIADRSARVPSPQEGMTGWMRDSNRMVTFTGTEWVQIWPATPEVTSGTVAPSGTAAVGSLYVRY